MQMMLLDDDGVKKMKKYCGSLWIGKCLFVVVGRVGGGWRLGGLVKCIFDVSGRPPCDEYVRVLVGLLLWSCICLLLFVLYI